MASCCYGDEYSEVFSPKGAAARARRFHRKGLVGSAKDLVTTVGERASGEQSLLAVGGGVGEIQLALLQAGTVQTVTNVELSPSWEGSARELSNDLGLGIQVNRLVADFIDLAPELPASDLVVLHRVVCCYPHWRRMLESAIAKTKHLMAITFPRDHWWSRAMIAVENFTNRVRRVNFRAFVHPPEAMIEFAQAAGMNAVSDQPRGFWRTVVFERSAAV